MYTRVYLVIGISSSLLIDSAPVLILFMPPVLVSISLVSFIRKSNFDRQLSLIDELMSGV